MAIGYHGIKLSGNVVETPEGYLVFKNAVIARTGFYEYKGKELLADEITAKELAEQNVDIDPEATIKVYRSPEEIFSKRSIDSFQGKPVTDGHPPRMLDLDTVAEHECGQVFNVREGKEPLEDGNFPLLGDIIVKSADLIDKWRAGIRELSCGYNYHIVNKGGTLCQVDNLGNHVAFVENGRAGIYARVNDSKLIGEMTMAEQHELAIGTGLKHVADKSTASEFGAFLRGMFSLGRGGGAALDSASKDEDKHPEGCRCDDCKPEAKDAKAAKAKDEAERAEKEKAEAEDKAAMDELEKKLGEDGEESAATDEDKHPEGCRCDDCKPEAKDEDEHMSEGEDGLEDNASTPIAPADRQQKDTPSATDAAFKAGAEYVLKHMKPFVARSKNTPLAGAFDTIDKTVKGTGWKGAASYGAVARAAGTANDTAIRQGYDAVEKNISDMEAAYAASRAKKLGRK